MVGDRDANSQFNLVTQGRRQPGSSFKPFALIAALEQGIDPDTKYVSEKKEYKVDVGLDKPEKWKVQNYDGIVRGEISLEEALWWSDNTVFADLAMNAGGRGLKNGPEEIADVAKSCGITADFGPNIPSFDRARHVRGLSAGHGVAYATIANEGRRVEPTAISRVVSHEGESDEKILYMAPEHPEGKQVISEDIAHKATGIMVGDVTEGIAKDASLGDRPVAGKTGTSENFFDAWFIGYTPELVTGTWMGYAEGGQTLEYVLDYARKLHGLSGGITPAEIWKTYTETILSGEPIEQFEGVEIPEKSRPPPRPAEPPRTERTPAVPPVTAPPRIRQPRGPPPETPSRQRRRAPLHPVSSPSRRQSARDQRAPEPPATSSASASASAALRDSFRRHGDVSSPSIR